VPIGDDEFSTNKWQAGPSLLYMNKTSHKVLWGVLGYNLNNKGRENTFGVKVTASFIKYEMYDFVGRFH
jgi:hypothetical protein